MNPAALLLVTALVPSQDPGATKARTSEHQHQVDQNGDRAMGFSHEKTTHHFLLEGKGGAVQVEANAADDKESREQIQAHLGHIAKMFAEGNFNTPMLVHSVLPPGTPTMTRLKAEIRFSYESSPKGGRIVMATSNKEALDAIHEFLRFQIKDHNTGDPLIVDAKD
ncbi:MAG: hypothetical protein JJE39_15710 [Vicinamibacteria bacterium]|nr:hypothetical protein [Vicinamibacteria bacterium]